MAVRRLYVIWTHPLFHDSARLLLKHPDVLWVGAATDFTTALEEIKRLHPDTILFEKMGSGFLVDLLELLETEVSDLRIIGFSLENNEMSLYHREHQTVIKAGDLLQFVLG